MAPARVVLLLITVALFAAAWSGDRPDDVATVMAAPGSPPPVTSGRDLGPLVQWEATAPATSWETRFAAMESDNNAAWRLLSNLPRGITPGTYLAVHANGHTERLTVDVEMLHTLGYDPDVTPQSTHTVDVDGATLVFVRIQSKPQRVVIAEGVTGRRRM